MEKRLQDCEHALERYEAEVLRCLDGESGFSKEMLARLIAKAEAELRAARQEYAKVLPGKIFEYLAAGRPVLGIGQEDGAAAEVLRDAGAGGMFGWDRRDGLMEFICGAHDGASGIGKYSRRVLTEKLVELL